MLYGHNKWLTKKAPYMTLKDSCVEMERGKNMENVHYFDRFELHNLFIIGTGYFLTGLFLLSIFIKRERFWEDTSTNNIVFLLIDLMLLVFGIIFLYQGAMRLYANK